MVLPHNVELPDDSELTVQEINVSWPTLHAASFYLGKKCEWENNEFMLCRQETGDPRKCLNEGKQVTACAMKFLQGLKKHCRDEFERYQHCLENSSCSMDFSYCRKTQAVLDQCVLKNFGVERPDFGYFCQTKIHDSPRPPPPPRPIPDYPETPKLTDDQPRPNLRSRFFFTF